MDVKPPRDQALHLRVTAPALEALDKLAAQEQRTRSDMARILLGEALNRRSERAPGPRPLQERMTK